MTVRTYCDGCGRLVDVGESLRLALTGEDEVDLCRPCYREVMEPAYLALQQLQRQNGLKALLLHERSFSKEGGIDITMNVYEQIGGMAHNFKPVDPRDVA